jgi:hypothetical protein
MPGAPDFIEYTKELPKDSTSQKAKAKRETDLAAAPKANKPSVGGESTSKIAGKVTEIQL